MQGRIGHPGPCFVETLPLISGHGAKVADGNGQRRNGKGSSYEGSTHRDVYHTLAGSPLHGAAHCPADWLACEFLWAARPGPIAAKGHRRRKGALEPPRGSRLPVGKDRDDCMRRSARIHSAPAPQ